mmetsp:Transcript_33022/g.71147  ORF Transcript_33022/g.71147 Transcript_33022/m.71147 type:complete len:139 (-) Transcript_33022:9-425(-)
MESRGTPSTQDFIRKLDKRAHCVCGARGVGPTGSGRQHEVAQRWQNKQAVDVVWLSKHRLAGGRAKASLPNKMFCEQHEATSFKMYKMTRKTGNGGSVGVDWKAVSACTTPEVLPRCNSKIREFSVQITHSEKARNQA